MTSSACHPLGGGVCFAVDDFLTNGGVLVTAKIVMSLLVCAMIETIGQWISQKLVASDACRKCCAEPARVLRRDRSRERFVAVKEHWARMPFLYSSLRACREMRVLVTTERGRGGREGGREGGKESERNQQTQKQRKESFLTASTGKDQHLGSDQVSQADQQLRYQLHPKGTVGHW